MRAAGTEVAEPARGASPRVAPRYRVLLHDDPVTPMDVVVDILRRVFRKNLGDASRLMREAHETGISLIEVVPLEEAELHVEQAHSLARARSMPLSFSIERAD